MMAVETAGSGNGGVGEAVEIGKTEESFTTSPFFFLDKHYRI